MKLLVFLGRYIIHNLIVKIIAAYRELVSACCLLNIFMFRRATNYYLYKKK